MKNGKNRHTHTKAKKEKNNEIKTNPKHQKLKTYFQFFFLKKKTQKNFQKKKNFEIISKEKIEFTSLKSNSKVWKVSKVRNFWSAHWVFFLKILVCSGTKKQKPSSKNWFLKTTILTYSLFFPSFGWGCFSPLFCWVLLGFLLLSVVLLSPLRALGWSYFSGSQRHPGGVRGRQCEEKGGGGGQATPPAREGRERSTIEREEEGPPLNWTVLNFSQPNYLNSSC